MKQRKVNAEVRVSGVGRTGLASTQGAPGFIGVHVSRDQIHLVALHVHRLRSASVAAEKQQV